MTTPTPRTPGAVPGDRSRAAIAEWERRADALLAAIELAAIAQRGAS